MENNEKLERYISNQRKGNSMTIMLVLVLLALAGVTIYFANGKAEAEKNLSVVANQANDLQQYWKYQDSVSKSKLNACDSGYRLLVDSLLTLHNVKGSPSEPVALNNNNNRINYVDVAQAIKQNPAKVINSINSMIVPSTVQVYLHYQGQFTEEMNIVSAQLKIKPYNLENVQKLEINYNRQIRYFNKQDETIANNLAATLSKATGLTYQTNFIDDPHTPVKQIEVWIGEKKAIDRIKIQKDYDQYIQKVNKN
ncbi:MAG: hypothetical protein ABJA78_15585 [Ferruginibacter sp.]